MDDNKSNSTDNNELIDVEFEDYIPIQYYSCPEVADMLDLPESTIRYWCTKYKKFLKVKTIGRNRQFTDKNFEVLGKIKDSRINKHYTGEQTYEYLEKLYGSDSDSLEIIDEIPKNKNEIIIDNITDSITNNVMDEINKSLQSIFKQISSEIINQNSISAVQQNELKQYIDKKMNGISNNFDKKQDKIIELLQKTLENQEKSNKKSLFSKIFHKSNHK